MGLRSSVYSRVSIVTSTPLSVLLTETLWQKSVSSDIRYCPDYCNRYAPRQIFDQKIGFARLYLITLVGCEHS